MASSDNLSKESMWHCKLMRHTWTVAVFSPFVTLLAQTSGYHLRTYELESFWLSTKVNKTECCRLRFSISEVLPPPQRQHEHIFRDQLHFAPSFLFPYASNMTSFYKPASGRHPPSSVFDFTLVPALLNHSSCLSFQEITVNQHPVFMGTCGFTGIFPLKAVMSPNVYFWNTVTKQIVNNLLERV